MASRSRTFLSEGERAALVDDLTRKGELKPGEVYISKNAAVPGVPPESSFGTGCLSCGEDDDHANLLLCEACNDEYHTYCLDPPLRSVPTGDWFCGKCKIPSFEDDGLDKMVCSLPPSFTSRFGEVCWAQGGVGFGWWPAFIYDPRLTVGNARQLAKKNLGKRHLVYFFECIDAPFSVLPDSKISTWSDGLIQDYHIGKAARSAGKVRNQLFQQALQAATVEAGKPVEMRMDWNHTDQPQILPPPKFCNAISVVPSSTRKRARELSDQQNQRDVKKRGFGFLFESIPRDICHIPIRPNLTKAIQDLAAARSTNHIEYSQDGEFCCKLLKKMTCSAASSSENQYKNIGFVKLKSRKHCTFSDARKVIEDEIVPDLMSSNTSWKFFVPSLGPVSSKQESSLGPMFLFLRNASRDPSVGNGTLVHPLRVVLVECQHTS